MTHISRTLALAGAAGVLGSLALGGASAQAATAPAAAKAPYAKVSLSPSVKGNVLTFRYSASGAQHLVTTDGKVSASREPMGFSVTVDGKTLAEGEAGAPTCTTKGLAAFSIRGPQQTYRFSKPGTHTLKVSTWYCGKGGVRTATKTYKVKSTAPKAAATLKAAGKYTPGKPLALTATCGSASAARASVVGPRAMSAKLTRVGKSRQFTGSITVPKTLQGSWVRLRVTCSDGTTGTTVVSKVGAKKPAPAA